MKKTIGIILLVIASLNIIAVFGRISTGKSIGSPMYLVLILIFIVVGFMLIQKSIKNE